MDDVTSIANNNRLDQKQERCAMPDIMRSEDCGNSPKNQLVQEISIALATHATDFLYDYVAEDLRWKVVGRGALQQKTELGDFLDKKGRQAFDSLTIHHVMTHGKAGAVNGTLVLDDGETREFCDVYEFTSASGKQVQAITSYWVDIVDPRRAKFG